MAAKKRATAKKKAAATRKTTAKKAAAPASKKVKSVRDPYNKTAMYNHIAETTGLSKKQVASVFDEFRDLLEAHVKKGSAQQFVMPGLFKVKVIRKPATRARKGINPFTGEETMFKAKPARNVVKVQPLKGLKDMAS